MIEGDDAPSIQMESLVEELAEDLKEIESHQPKKFTFRTNQRLVEPEITETSVTAAGNRSQ